MFTSSITFGIMSIVKCQDHTFLFSQNNVNNQPLQRTQGSIIMPCSEATSTQTYTVVALQSHTYNIATLHKEGKNETWKTTNK